MTNTLESPPLTVSILRDEGGSDPGPAPERDKPEEGPDEPSLYDRVFTEDELDLFTLAVY